MHPRRECHVRIDAFYGVMEHVLLTGLLVILSYLVICCGICLCNGWPD